MLQYIYIYFLQNEHAQITWIRSFCGVTIDFQEIILIDFHEKEDQLTDVINDRIEPIEGLKLKKGKLILRTWKITY
jgi:hypothetical protein